MSQDQARRAVGKPERETTSLGMWFWDYPKCGVTVIWKEDRAGIHGVVVSSRAAGAVRGVKVGDRDAVVHEAWGTPARVRQDGRFLDLSGVGWVLSAEVRDGMVVEITLMAAGSINVERE
jgi:hypothetical protein